MIVFHRHVFRDPFPGIEVFQQKQRDRKDRNGDHQDGIAVDILFQPHGQQHHVEHHADHNAGQQRPGHLTDKLDLCFFLGITGGQGADGITEQIEIGRTYRMITDQKEEEIVPVALSHAVAREQEDQTADDNGNESKDQVPRPHFPLPGLGVLNEPAVEKSCKHGKDLCHGHDNFIYAAHLLDHGDIPDAVHSSGLLREEFLHQRRNGVDHKDQSQRTNQMAKHPFFCGYGLRFCPAVHKGLVKQPSAEQRFLFCACFHAYLTSSCIVTGFTPADFTVITAFPGVSPAFSTAKALPRYVSWYG